MFDYARYRDFIASKGSATQSRGFDLRGNWDGLFPHQMNALQFVCEKGMAAAFLDTGLGKSRIEAAAAEEYRRQTNKPSLILTPLAVARQMVRECEAVGVEARVVRDASDVWSGVKFLSEAEASKGMLFDTAAE